jgi:hypothetical protein
LRKKNHVKSETKQGHRRGALIGGRPGRCFGACEPWLVLFLSRSRKTNRHAPGDRSSGAERSGPAGHRASCLAPRPVFLPARFYGVPGLARLQGAGWGSQDPMRGPLPRALFCGRWMRDGDECGGVLDDHTLSVPQLSLCFGQIQYSTILIRLISVC